MERKTTNLDPTKRFYCEDFNQVLLTAGEIMVEKGIEQFKKRIDFIKLLLERVELIYCP